MKSKFRFNVLDAIIIAAVIAVAAAAILFLSDRKSGGGELHEIFITAELSQKPEGFHETVKNGAVYDAVKGEYIGEIVSVDYGPCITTSSTTDPEGFILTEIPSVETCIVKIKVNASVSDRATSVGNLNLNVGGTLYLRAASFSSTATVLTMEGDAWK